MQPTDSEGTQISNQPQPISELVTHPDFPQSAVGQNVDIGGYVGQVTEIVKHSLKIKSPEGTTRSFNLNTLMKLYGPRVEPEPYSEPQRQKIEKAPEPAEPEPARNVITEPDFSAPIKSISEFVKRPDFPQCAFGQHVEITDYVGVVVEIVKQSLKVRSQEEVTRSYNAEILKKLYGK